MPIEDRIARVLEEAQAAGELRPELRQRIEIAVRQSFSSERKRLRAEKLVAMSEEDAVRYRIISELATDWVYAARNDAETGTLRLEWATEVLERVTGYTVADLISGKGFRSIVAVKDLEEFDGHHFTEGVGLPRTHEYRIITKDGETRWLRDYRRPETDRAGTRVVRIFGAVKDITEQKRAEEALRDAMIELEQRVGTEVARFRAVMDQVGEVIFVVDPRTGSFVDVNETACTELGYTREELLFKRRIEDIYMGPLPWAQRSMEELSESKTSSELNYARKDGPPVPVEVTTSVRRFMGQDYLVLVARDIADRKVMEAQLAQSDRLASVGVLAAGVAHEINNPLVYIMNNLSYVLTHLPEGLRDLSSALREARSGAERVRDIVKDMKTFSRPDDKTIEPMDVREILDSAIKVAHNEIHHRAQLVRQYAEIPSVNANARLGQVFLNLVLNAAHAIPEGDVANNEILVRINANLETQEVIIQIRDTGTGILPEHLTKIFDPFFTTKPVGVGTGLGLSICRNIAEELGGRIEVTSDPGAGSTFTVTMPCSEENASRRLRPTSHPPAPSSRSLRVLVVDDDVLVARSVRRLLRPQHDVTIATSGQKALSLLVDHDYDVIFCDVMMPEMTGIELHAAVHKDNAAVARRFVFITGGPFTPEARGRFDAVTNPCIQKPFTPSDLASALEIALLAS